MSDFLFVYGTLRPGHAPEEIAPAVAELALIGEGFVNGVLYDLGGYPGAVLGPSRQERINGAVYQLPSKTSVLADLDAYEGFDPRAPLESLFVRMLHPVMLPAGGTLQCWVYVYNRDPGNAPVISG